MLWRCYAPDPASPRAVGLNPGVNYTNWREDFMLSFDGKSVDFLGFSVVIGMLALLVADRHWSAWLGNVPL